MKRLPIKRLFQTKWRTSIAPKVIKVLEANKAVTFDWDLEFNKEVGNEIKYGKRKQIMDLDQWTCTCRSWQLTAIPYPYVTCVIFKARKKIKDEVDDCYKKVACLNAYQYAI